MLADYWKKWMRVCGRQEEGKIVHATKLIIIKWTRGLPSYQFRDMLPMGCTFCTCLLDGFFARGREKISTRSKMHKLAKSVGKVLKDGRLLLGGLKLLRGKWMKRSEYGKGKTWMKWSFLTWTGPSLSFMIIILKQMPIPIAFAFRGVLSTRKNEESLTQLLFYSFFLLHRHLVLKILLWFPLFLVIKKMTSWRCCIIDFGNE